jgi:hypothetical protein
MNTIYVKMVDYIQKYRAYKIPLSQTTVDVHQYIGTA